MRKRGTRFALQSISFWVLLAALTLTTLQLIRFSRMQTSLPLGLEIAGIPVGGLDRQSAAQRLLDVYSRPVELRYDQSRIHLIPSEVDFQLDVKVMLESADRQGARWTFWQKFRDFLWGKSSSPVQIPLRASFSEARLGVYLEELARIYDRAPQAARPVPGTVNYVPGRPGSSLEIEASMALIKGALYSITDRQVDLPIRPIDPPPPVFENIGIQLRQLIQVSGFDGLVGIYLLDLQTAQELHFAIQRGQELPVKPDIAFSASSLVKIPIMISAVARMGENPDPETLKLLEDMIAGSGNEAADWLMDRVIDPRLGPVLVSEDMSALGLENTFLGGYFTIGSPLLVRFTTPANQRTDITTDPDIYSQTTPSDMGMLLEDIYQCAQSDGGTLRVVFSNEITQTKCQRMIATLHQNRVPLLLTAGLPDGTSIAHKHGWVSVNGIMDTLGDAGIISSPGGNYIFVVFLYHPVQIIWESSNGLVIRLSQAVYNYYNLPR